MKKAIVFGASGQIGSYLVELLREKKYYVETPTRQSIDFDNLKLAELHYYLASFAPEEIEIYNLAGINSAEDSWMYPSNYLKVNGMSVVRLLTILAEVLPNAKFFQAGSAEVFEKDSIQQYEDTNRLPANPYGLSKMLALEAVRIFRDKYKLFACTGIFFNAESPRRDKKFFAEKVAMEVAKLRKQWDTVAKIPQDKIKLGRLDARRDWGWAPEYAEVAWKMLQQEKSYDLNIGTGDTHTCKEFVIEALKVAGFDDAEKNFDSYVDYDKTEELGNCMRARPVAAWKVLGWEAKYKFKDVVRMLVEAELRIEALVG
jgi:GDPmannose 4,6-dehydratase